LRLLNPDVVAGVLEVRDHPVVYLVSPFAAPFNPHVFLRRHELIDNQMFKADLASEFPDPIHEVLPFAVDDVADVIKLTLGLPVFSPNLVDLSILTLKFFLLIAVVLPQIDFDLLFRLEFLLKDGLLPSAFLKFSSGFQHFLLLLLDQREILLPCEHLGGEVVEFANQLLLGIFFLLLILIFLS